MAEQRRGEGGGRKYEEPLVRAIDRPSNLINGITRVSIYSWIGCHAEVVVKQVNHSMIFITTDSVVLTACS